METVKGYSSWEEVGSPIKPTILHNLIGEVYGFDCETLSGDSK